MDGLWRSHTKNKGKHVSKPNRIKVILCWFCCRAGPTTVTSFSLLSMCGKPRLMEGHRVCVLVFWATESLDSKTKSSSVTLTCRQQWDNTFRWNTSSCFYWLSWWCFLLILWWWKLWRDHCSLSQSYMSEVWICQRKQVSVWALREKTREADFLFMSIMRRILFHPLTWMMTLSVGRLLVAVSIECRLNTDSSKGSNVSYFNDPCVEKNHLHFVKILFVTEYFYW